jgi:hypothetical protein
MKKILNLINYFFCGPSVKGDVSFSFNVYLTKIIEEIPQGKLVQLVVIAKEKDVKKDTEFSEITDVYFIYMTKKYPLRVSIDLLGADLTYFSEEKPEIVFTHVLLKEITIRRDRDKDSLIIPTNTRCLVEHLGSRHACWSGDEIPEYEIMYEGFGIKEYCEGYLREDLYEKLI